MMKYLSRENSEKEELIKYREIFLINEKEKNIFNIINEKDNFIIEIEPKIFQKINKKKSLNISLDNFLKENIHNKINDIYIIIQDLFKINIQGIEFKITYDINNSFVNLNREDIMQVIYNKYIENQNLNKNISIEDLEDIILEKISLVLPQELILLMQYNKYKLQHPKQDKIICFYKKGEHINLINFIKKMEYKRNIIYTFTKIDEPLLLDINNNINTKLFGKIKKNNIKEININSMISENEFKKELDNFYSNTDDLIIILKIDPKFIDLKKYINLINLLFENNENEKKVFIFTVHINIIFEEEIKDANESEFINYNNFYYKDYYQTFIDDLNDKEYNSLEEKISIKENINIEEIILNFIVYQVNKITEDNTIFKFTNILIKCSKIYTKFLPFLSAIFKKIININPECILNNFDYIKNCNKLYINLINNYNNEVLNEILLKVYENYFNLYFESITNLSKEEMQQYFPKYFENYKNNNIIPAYILFDKSLELFKKCINFLEDIYKKSLKNNNDMIKNELLCKLFCISYIKLYLYKAITLNFNNNDNIYNIDEIIKVIEGNENNNFRKMIKIYVFKIYFYLFNNNYQEFSNYNYLKYNIKFFQEFREKIFEKSMLTYYLAPREDKFLEYEKMYNKFQSIRFNDFNDTTLFFKDYIENNGIDLFFILSINLIVSNKYLNNNVNESIEYLNYCSYINKLFDDKKSKIGETTRKLFLFFSNNNIFTNLIKINNQENNKIDLDLFELLLYSLYICLQTTNCQKPNDYLYSSIITKHCEKILEDNCIPGNNNLDNVFVNNYYLVEKHLNQYNAWYGAYVCSCGFYYDISPCGLPNMTSICYNCGQKIGKGENPPGINGPHPLVQRPGHFRIFKDLAQKNEVFNRFGDNDKNVPNMLLQEYKTKIIDPIIEKSILGINKVSITIFEDNFKNVRKLSYIGYRLLNFILYSHLFYSNCLGFISEEKLKNYIVDGMTCLQMIKIDWNLLKDALQSKGIQIIQIFMNLIIPKICEKLKNCKFMKSNEERENFENNIEKLLQDTYIEYESYSKKY